MNTNTLKFNCYVEGIRLPIFGCLLGYERNQLSAASIQLPLGKKIDPLAWANAYIQITVLDGFEEKRLFDGLCMDLNIQEDTGFLEVSAISVWDIFNFNTTLDYVSPKKYGLKNLDEGLRIWIGSEDSAALSNSELYIDAGLSNRYYHMSEDTEDIFALTDNDTETRKLLYILNLTPSASRLASVFLEDIAYANFFLTRVYAERFNLLQKTTSGDRLKLAKEQAATTKELATGFFIEIDPDRIGFYNDVAAKEAYVPSGVPGDTTSPTGAGNINLPNITTSQAGEAAYQMAVSQLGVRESGGKNRGPEIDTYLKYTSPGIALGSAYCASGASWSIGKALEKLGKQNIGPKTPSAHDFMIWGKQNKVAKDNPSTSDLVRGDVVFHDHKNGSRRGHVAIVESVSGSSVVTIDFNSPDGCDRKTRNISWWEGVIKWYLKYQ